ncbi:hypothetical protein ADUPG1_009990 [Aduncisulcus paluster]|uniref:Uncharacterized protein n=1 Tax=Aduncisulcus paluster TaxID=2918883 RepID=A0ABQ5KXG7_9EUKA|nr:hypothetical protein ADUPG1_009990 [Aduncisulcus paluster]
MFVSKPTTKPFSKTYLEKLRVSIKRTTIELTSLYEKSQSRLQAIFDEYSTPSTITSNRDLFTLCFECLFLFVKHKIPKEEATDGKERKDETPEDRDKENIEIILDKSSIINLIDSFLPQMIKVEAILRMNEEGINEEEEDSGTKETGVSSITMILFRILNVSLGKVESIRIKIFPQISSILSKILALGISQKLENSFIEDILITCRNFAFAENNYTKDSLLSLLLPHILPWMKKYPDKKFFLHWTNILKNVIRDKDNENVHKGRSSQLWFVFHPILDVITDTDSKGILFDDESIIRCLLLFAHLCCIPCHAIEVHQCIKVDDLLDSWFELVKKKKEEKSDMFGIKYWSNLISMLSSVPSLVPQLSPKFDDEMYWCMKNGGWSYDDYLMYLSNCYASLKKWKEFIDSVKKCPDYESTSKLYHEHRDEIHSVFLEYQSKSEIEEHKKEIVLCVLCLGLFVRHDISGNMIYLPILDLNDLTDTFIAHLSRCGEVLGEDVDEEYCEICGYYSFKVKDKKDSFLPKISPTFQRILERGSKEKFGGNVAINLLKTLRNISNSPASSTRSSILTLIKPYIKDWLRIYNDSKCYGEWMYILSNITLFSDETPNKSLCSEAWPLFHPVLDVVTREFLGDTIVEDDHEWVLLFFSNLCCDPSHAVGVFGNVKDILDGWFEAIKKKEYRSGIIFWSRLISIFSTLPAIIPQICPKFDANMEWCKNNGALWGDYTRYLSNSSPCCHKLIELLNLIKHCRGSTSPSKLYHEHKQLLSEFLSHESNCDIKEHQREITLCIKCLSCFMRYDISRDKTYLPPSDINDLIDTFIGHLSRVGQVLAGDVDEEYCSICMCYSFKARVEDMEDLFQPEISPTFQCILERGSKKKLRGRIAQNLLKTLRNISNSPASSTRSAILTLIKPYIKDWLKIYNDSKCYGEWMFILSFITLSSDNTSPNKSLCSEAWPLFHPVLDVVKREFVGDKIVENNHECVLSFFSNLCCDPAHAVEIFDNIKDILDEWCETIMIKRNHIWGIIVWSNLIFMFSTVSSLVSLISPKYDDKMKQFMHFDRYLSNISSYLSSPFLAKLLHSIPPVSLIPSIETSLCPEKDGYSYASHVCCRMSVEADVDTIITFVVNIITKKEMKKDQQTIQRGRLCFGTKDEHTDDIVGKRRFFSPGIEDPSHTLSATMGIMEKESINSHIPDKMLDMTSSQRKQSTLMDKELEDEEKKNCIFSFGHNYRIKHSSIIQYTPPQHLLVKMPFDEERSLRQSVYDFVENTGGGVESLFDHETCQVSFEGYDQESWKEGMEIIEGNEEEREENSCGFRPFQL